MTARTPEQIADESHAAEWYIGSRYLYQTYIKARGNDHTFMVIHDHRGEPGRIEAERIVAEHNEARTRLAPIVGIKHDFVPHAEQDYYEKSTTDIEDKP